jgi:hypothetical protein
MARGGCWWWTTTKRKRRKPTKDRKRRRKTLKGGAYVDLPSFGGNTTDTTSNMYAYNTAAGSNLDPVTPVNLVSSRTLT